MEENKKKKRKIKIPISYCKDMNELSKQHKTIKSVNYYQTKIEQREYLFDIIETIDKQYYIHIVDITSGYEDLDFNKFKARYSQPTLFDDFFNI